jgi:hypothetical protein
MKQNILTPVTLLTLAVIAGAIAVVNLGVTVLFFYLWVKNRHIPEFAIGHHPTKANGNTLLGIACTAAVFLLLRQRRKLQRRLHKQCEYCGYPTVGNPTPVCPECGNTVVTRVS